MSVAHLSPATRAMATKAIVMGRSGSRTDAPAEARSDASLRWAARFQPSLAYVAAAVLTAAALTAPLWGFAMSAPQYPDETLHLQVARSGIGGDVHEVSTLQQYIGVQFPTALPELTWATRAIVVLALLLAIAAFAGAGRVARIYRRACATGVILFLIASAVAVQARLYQVGHERDPNAPIRAVKDFTPPLVGPVKVGNFTVWSFPHVGAVMLIAAAVLSIAGARRKSA